MKLFSRYAFWGTLCCTFVFNSASFGQQPDPSAKSIAKDSVRGHQGKFKEMIKEMNLSESQKQALATLRKAGKEERKATMETIKGVRESIKQELLKPLPDQKKLEGYSEQLALTHKKMSGSMINHLLETKKILSKEQFEKLLSFQWGKDHFREGKNKDDDD